MKRVRALLTMSNLVIIVAIAALLAVATAYFVSNAQAGHDKEQTILIQRSRITTLLKQNGKLQSQLTALTHEYTKLYGQTKAAGVQPTTVAPSSLSAATTSGSPGQNGRDGRGVLTATCTSFGLIVTYTDGSTDNAGTCVGAAGKDGTNGTNGTDSTVPGPAGAAGVNGADSTVPGPKGDTGDTGAAGPAGAAGVGVSTVTCVLESDGSTDFEFLLTDGTTQDVPGTCTPPTPTADPSAG